MTRFRDPRQFSPTDHLASEAVAAYVDGELRMNAYLRAARHVSECASCADEVQVQQQARVALQGSPEMSMPSSLLGLLHQIPHCTSPEPGRSEPGIGSGLRHGLGSVVGSRFRRR
ncbi:hypothetical protein [Rhodococcus sp. MEB041]|uniref:hypothetical protein n=1 Tax=Rhodococcus sp. MEB041 TaxID=3040323 RepID=UPI00254E442C|nr:hypothetical protein [Rhodococcus sp. MEB041]